MSNRRSTWWDLPANYVVAVRLDDVALLHGDAAESLRAARSPRVESVLGGVWACSPGTFERTFGSDEMAYLLFEGEVVIEQEGRQPITVRPGDFLNYRKGTKSLWIIKTASGSASKIRSARIRRAQSL